MHSENRRLREISHSDGNPHDAALFARLDNDYLT
jgi:hypothetical protein